ncbi:MAG: LolA family protein [Limisphaerales bacterium]
MNEREPRDEQDLARLIRAGFGPDARPEAAKRREVLRRLQEVCRAEFGPAARAQARPANNGQAKIQVSSVGPAIGRARREQTEYKTNTQQRRDTLMSKLLSPWGLGLGAATAAAAAVGVLVLTTPRAHATASDVLAKGAQAVAQITSIHLRGQMRTAPADNLSMLQPTGPLVPIELWKQFEPEKKWRVEKPGRVEVMDGQSIVMLIRPRNLAFRWGPDEAKSDASWLQRVSNLSQTLTNELKSALAKGWKLSLADQRGADGRNKSVVTVEARSNLPDDDFLKNASIDLSDSRWVYRFDSQTELLESVQAYLSAKSGEALILDIDQIEYNQPIDPAVFTLQLPTNVAWAPAKSELLADKEQYPPMTASEAARAFFEACGREDWAAAGKFWIGPLDDQFKTALGGLKVISIGQPFTSAGGGDPFVPYEIQFKDGTTHKFNLHIANVPTTGRWIVSGGL